METQVLIYIADLVCSLSSITDNEMEVMILPMFDLSTLQYCFNLIGSKTYSCHGNNCVIKLCSRERTWMVLYIPWI